jgi:arylsulfatase A-like enzyme
MPFLQRWSFMLALQPKGADMRKGVKIGVGIVVALGVTAFLAKDHVLLHMTGWLSPPVYENRPVVWQKGPVEPKAPAAERAPNIILIVADDLGYNDISLNGGGVGGLLKTPNIDALAREGAVFANGYAGNATCSPSRAALMTGRYPTRFGFEFTSANVRFARTIAGFPTGSEYQSIFDEKAAEQALNPDDMGVPASEVTLAELMRGHGYRTLHLGKWHLGGAKGMRPEDQGFDESLGFIIGGQMFLPEDDPEVVNSKQDFDPIDKYLWANLPFSVQYNGSDRFHPDRYMTDYLTKEAVAAIDANRNRPFFMYLAYNAPHTPLQALKSDYDALPQIRDHRTRVYAAMIRALDRGVGEIVAALKARGLDENTLIVFTSDNGGAHYIGLPDINRPYRGWKASLFEGGIKVPFFMRWPSRIPAASRVDTVVSHFDIFATAGAAANAVLPSDRPLDGLNLLPATTGGTVGPREALFWKSGAYRVVQAGEWKMQVLMKPEKTLLYNLREDPTEQRDAAGARPDVVARLSAMLAAQDRQNTKPAWPALVHVPVPIDRPLGTPAKPGEMVAYWSN